MAAAYVVWMKESEGTATPVPRGRSSNVLTPLPVHLEIKGAHPGYVAGQGEDY